MSSADDLRAEVLDAAPDAMLIVDGAGFVRLANLQAERLFGYAAGALVGCSIDALVPDDVRAHHRAQRDGYLADPQPRPMGVGRELFARRQDGTLFPAEISLAPLRSAEGLNVIAAIRDLTQRRKVEQRFRRILDAAPDAIVIADRQGKIVMASAQTEVLFGHARESLVGQPVEALVPERFRHDHQHHRAGYVAAPAARAMGSGLALYGLRADGSEFPVEISLSPIETDEGLLIASAIRDISERKRAEAVLRDAHDALELRTAQERAVNRELEAFSYSVAHDLRAPLRGMIGFAQVLVEDHGDRLDADGRDCLREIQWNAQRMGALIDALLSLSRVTRSPLYPGPVDLGALARAAIDQLAQAEPERRVEVHIAPGLEAELDPRLARVLIDNLVQNAWKFTGRTDDARICVGQAMTEHGPAFFVRDNGAGFDMSFASKLFAPFQRLHAISEFPGTGIGLATVQRIVLRHGGIIWAEATVGHGATFWFTVGVRGEGVRST